MTPIIDNVLEVPIVLNLNCLLTKNYFKELIQPCETPFNLISESKTCSRSLDGRIRRVCVPAST